MLALLSHQELKKGVENGNLLYESRYGRGEIESYEGQQEFNDRYSQAKTYHQLGMVAQKKRQVTAG